jgi:hypothetical protein
MQSECKDLLESLKTSISNLVQEVCNGIQSDSVLIDDNANVKLICYLIEKILLHGVKTSFFGATREWKYLEHLNQCLPGTDAFLHQVRALGNSDCARTRLFIRLALNENSLGDYLSALAWNAETTEAHYKNGALMKEIEYRDTFLLLLEGLKKFQFGLCVKDRLLERQEYWGIVGVPTVQRTPSICMEELHPNDVAFSPIAKRQDLPPVTTQREPAASLDEAEGKPKDKGKGEGGDQVKIERGRKETSENSTWTDADPNLGMESRGDYPVAALLPVKKESGISSKKKKGKT